MRLREIEDTFVQQRMMGAMKTEGAKEVVERCLIHWFPELPPSKRRDVAVSILGNLTAADYLAPVEDD